MEKIDWKKSEAGYSIKKRPQILVLPEQHFFSINGVGDPNDEDFQRRVASLYAWSYAVRMSPKKDWLIPNYQPYTVYPLEGLWGLQEKYLNEKVMQKKTFFLSINDQTTWFCNQRSGTGGSCPKCA